MEDKNSSDGVSEFGSEDINEESPDEVPTESKPTESISVTTKVISENEKSLEHPLAVDDWTQKEYYQFYGYYDVIEAREKSFEEATETKPFGKSQVLVAEYDKNTEDLIGESFDIPACKSDLFEDNKVSSNENLESLKVEHKFTDLRKYEFFDNLIEHHKSTVSTDGKSSVDNPTGVTDTKEEIPNDENSEVLEETAVNQNEASCKFFVILTRPFKIADVDTEESVCRKRYNEKEVPSDEMSDEFDATTDAKLKTMKYPSKSEPDEEVNDAVKFKDQEDSLY